MSIEKVEWYGSYKPYPPTDDGIIATSPMIFDDGPPHRIVIRDLGNEFVVHTQIVELEFPRPRYTDGDYYNKAVPGFAPTASERTALQKAYCCFDRRARKSLRIGED